MRLAHRNPNESEQALGILQRTLYVATSMQLTFFSYRFAAEVLDSPEFIDKKNDHRPNLQGLGSASTARAEAAPTSARYDIHPDQKALNVALNNRFKEKEWECQPFVTNDRVTKI
ncbi:MAG: hypothetical protein ACLPND_17820 [Candidatus Korobacteraceae bacterium]